MVELKLIQPKNRELNGGDLLAQCLVQLGVEVAFGIHGGHLDAFFMGCSDNGIRLVDARHETVAVQAAEGYSKIKGAIGVAFVTANSGFVNGLPGLASALADRSSILVITSSPPMADAETNTIQGYIDQIAVARTLTKYAQRVPQPEEIPRFVAAAYRTAISGAPGPVLLDIPCDVLWRPVYQSRIAWGSITSPLPVPPGPSSKAITEAVRLWRAACKPVVIVGSGGRTPEAAIQLAKLVKATNTPLFHGAKYRQWNIVDSAYEGGSSKNLGGMAAAGAGRPDFVLLLACRPGMYLGGRAGVIIPKEDCKLVHVDTDGTEIGRILPVDLGIVADLTETLIALNNEVAKSPVEGPKSWLNSAVGLQMSSEERSDAAKEPEEIYPGRMNPYHAVKRVFSALEPGAIVCFDGGESALWGSDTVGFARPHITLGALGYLVLLGNGFGYSLGAAIADPSRQIVNIQGDGSAGFHISSLDTYARFKLNILTVVVNNYVWAMSIHGQELFYGEDEPVRNISRLSPDAQYDVVARGFGVAAAKVERIEKVAAAVNELAQKKGPGLINLIVAETPIHPVTRIYMNANPDPNQINIPYYAPIPRPFYKE
ncbi:Benzoin aldolase [Hyphodiscus hymeniophilus]|uniref:Benzoin aldolase n=1 Tax=Hyphodiscus hymeniophilus TaxID=353542 RepID=A0A9P7AVE9_9HELO|nr:Benzoin aldolase [Hyphodiscus hymeniophilus]